MTRITPNSPGVSNTLLNQHRRNTEQVADSIERLSTGKRINRPSDDPAGFVAAENLKGDIIDLQAESRAAKTNRFRVRQRESALSEIQRTLNRVRGKLVSAADSFNTPAQQSAIQSEIDASLDAVDLVASRVEGVRDSSDLKELRAGGTANVIDGNIAAAADLVEGKLEAISSSRAAAGAYLKNDDIFEQLRSDQIVISKEALSHIEDTDFAQETSRLVEGQILSEASIQALAYANRESIEQIEELLEDLGSDS